VRAAFGFLRIPARPVKPRKVGLTIVTDRGLSLRQTEDLFETFGPILDYIKLTDFVGLATRYSADWLRRKAALCAQHEVGILPGGIAFQLAALQNQVERFFDTCRELGFTAVEVSEDSIPALPEAQRTAWIRRALDAGLEVFTEIGKKVPDAPLSVAESVASIRADLDRGAKKVVIEKADIALLKEEGKGDVLVEIAEAVGHERLCFEGGPAAFPDLPLWLIKTFGPQVNLENLEVNEIVRVEGMRVGVDRLVDYDFLRLEGGRV
jgi:phosphosulfolactate synthase